MKFFGCQERPMKGFGLGKMTKHFSLTSFLEARMILVPELTLTRTKYWLKDHSIVLQDLQILDSQIYNKQ